MLICLFTVLKQLPHWKCLFSISSKKSSYKINKCLLLLPIIWLLVCIEVGKLKPREINIFNRSSNRWKWWNLWCPKRCWSPWVWESTGPSARWCDSSDTAVQAGAGGSAAPFPAPWQAGTASLLHQQSQRCPPSAGRAHTACSLCTGPLPLMLSNMWLPKPTSCALLVVFLAQRVPVQVNDLKDTTVFLPNPQMAGHPFTKPAFVVDGVKSHSETLNVNVSAVTMWSWSKRSWLFKVMADEKCMQE